MKKMSDEITKADLLLLLLDLQNAVNEMDDERIDITVNWDDMSASIKEEDIDFLKRIAIASHINE